MGVMHHCVDPPFYAIVPPMKKPILLFLNTVAAGLLMAQPSGEPQIMAIDGYAARVNSKIITYGDVREQVQPIIRQIVAQTPEHELSQRISQAYLEGREALIEEALLNAEAKALGLTLPPHVIESEINRVIRERFNNDRALLARALAARRMTYEEWKQEAAEQIAMSLFYDREVLRRASVSEQAVRDEYEKNRAAFFVPMKARYRYILINKGTTDEDRAVKRQQAEATLQKLREGADFSAVAIDVSEGDPSEMPWREIQNVHRDFQPAVRSTPVGQVSDLIETADAFYLLQVLERREEGVVPFEDVRSRIESRLLAEERHRLHRELIRRLSAKHYVERY